VALRERAAQPGQAIGRAGVSRRLEIMSIRAAPEITRKVKGALCGDLIALYPDVGTPLFRVARSPAARPLTQMTSAFGRVLTPVRGRGGCARSRPRGRPGRALRSRRADRGARRNASTPRRP